MWGSQTLTHERGNKTFLILILCPPVPVAYPFVFLSHALSRCHCLCRSLLASSCLSLICLSRLSLALLPLSSPLFPSRSFALSLLYSLRIFSEQEMYGLDVRTVLRPEKMILKRQSAHEQDLPPRVK